MRKNIKLVIQYDGSKYQGWQRLGDSSKKTIQGVLEEILQKILQEPIQLIGSGRTDAGVHAYAQVANFYVSEANLKKQLYAGEEIIQAQEKRISKSQEVSQQEKVLKGQELKSNQQEKREFYQRELESKKQGKNISLKRLELNKQQMERYQKFQKRLNQILPEDIKIIRIEEVPDKFHSRYCASKKTYEYHLSIGQKASVFNRNYITCIQQALDIEKMKQAAVYFLGTHDFKGFSSEMKDGRKTQKTIYQLSIQKKKEEIIISIQADGFLYNMVRIIVGTLVEIGQSKKSPERILEIFETRDRQLAGYTIEAKGLFLKSVDYNSIV